MQKATANELLQGPAIVAVMALGGTDALLLSQIEFRAE